MHLMITNILLINMFHFLKKSLISSKNETYYYHGHLSQWVPKYEVIYEPKQTGRWQAREHFMPQPWVRHISILTIKTENSKDELHFCVTAF